MHRARYGRAVVVQAIVETCAVVVANDSAFSADLGTVQGSLVVLKIP